MSDPFDPATMIRKAVADGARVHQLRFARERLEKLRANLVLSSKAADGLYRHWIEDVDYALAQIKAAESTL